MRLFIKGDLSCYTLMLPMWLWSSNLRSQASSKTRTEFGSKLALVYQ
jgi:hypothetical protein